MYNPGLNENYELLIININELLTIMRLFITYLNQNVEGPKCQNPRRLEISHFEKGFAKLTLKAGRVSSTFFLAPELIRGSPYTRGLEYPLFTRGPIKYINNSFYV